MGSSVYALHKETKVAPNDVELQHYDFQQNDVVRHNRHNDIRQDDVQHDDIRV